MALSAGLDAVNLTGKSFPQLQAALKRLREVSIPQLFAERVKDNPDAVAVRYKRDGVFRELTWSGYREEIRKVAAGLLQCGLEPGARIAIMGDVSIEYLLADLAATFVGAIPCGVYPTSSPEEVAYVMRLAGTRIFVAEDQEHLDRLLDAEATENAPLVDKIIVCDERALFLYDDPRIELLSEVTRKGREDARSLAEVSDLESKVTPDLTSAIIFTSGTTGYPKAAYRTQSADVIGFGFSFLEVMPEMRARPHRVVCQLPLAHGMGRAVALYVPLLATMVPHIGEPNQSLPSLMNEVRPTYVMGVPRTWEKIVANVQVSVDSAGFVARSAFALATSVGRKRVREIWNQGSASWYLEAVYWPLWLTVIWPALHKLGLTYANGACSGGAPLPPIVHETLEAWGIPMRDMFGMTETGGIGAQVGKWPAPDSAIRPMAACQVRVSDDGELCLRTPGNVIGYWNDELASEGLFGPDGYVRSGDIATVFEGGAFRIVDRKKDILITSGGKNIAPAAVENALRCSPYISEVIAFGDQRKYVTALIEIDFENVAQWARQRQIPYTGYMSLSQNENVIQLIAKEVEELNHRLARVEQVKKFRILSKELVPEDGDTTPTRKVKRAHTYNLFGDMVEDMYAEDDLKKAINI
jgi:long-chain acyl-CoA synthetase